MKKAVSIVLAILLVFSSFAVQGFALAEEEIKIAFTSDIHGRYAYAESKGTVSTIGFAKMKTFLDNEDVDLLFDAGDLFHGISFATINRGESIAELANEMGYAAMVAGNHDFNYGIDRLKALSEISGMPVLATNVQYKNGEPFCEDYLIKEVNGTKIGVFGLVDREVVSQQYTKDLKFEDMVSASKRAVSYLQEQGCAVVIALAHTLALDTLAAQTSGIDVLIGGHSHQVIHKTVKDTLIVQAGSYMSNVGIVSLHMEGSALQSMDASIYGNELSTIVPDAQTEAKISEINEKQLPILNTAVGSVDTDLEATWESVRAGQTDIGRLIATSYLQATGADVAFENAGGIRAGLKAGDITKGNIIDVLPFGNYVVTKKVTGKELAEIFETSLDIMLRSKAANDNNDWDGWPQNSGSYLQFAGADIKYDVQKEPGSRIYSIVIDGKEICPINTYTVAANQYIADSKDYPSLKQAQIQAEYPNCDEVLIEYINAFGVTAKGGNLLDQPCEKPTGIQIVWTMLKDVFVIWTHFICTLFGLECKLFFH